MHLVTHRLSFVMVADHDLPVSGMLGERNFLKSVTEFGDQDAFAKLRPDGKVTLNAGQYMTSQKDSTLTPNTELVAKSLSPPQR